MSRYMRRIKKEAMTRLFSVLPRETRDNLIRSKVKLDYKPPEGLRFKLAETKEELEQVFRLLYHSYVASGSMKPNPSEVRITPYHALPSTSILIAVLNGKVIATLSVFRMGPFGIPASKVFNVTNLINAGIRFAEISSLTIDESYRSDNREIIFGLLKYLYEYTTKYFGIDMKLIVIKPFRRFFYESLLLFEPLENRIVKNYGFSNGATVMSEKLDLRTAKERLKAIYSKYPDEQNLYKYFVENKIENFEFPNRQYHLISDPVMTPELLSYFFCEKTNILKEMSEFERSVLRSLYPQSKYKLVLNSSLGAMNSKYDRLEVRLDTDCPSRIMSLDQSSLVSRLGADMQVRNISYHGLMGFTSAQITAGERFRILVEIGDRLVSTLDVVTSWKSGFGHYGFKIEKADDSWNTFVSQSSTFSKKETA